MKKFFSMIAVLAAMFAFAACSNEPATDKPEPTPSSKKLATPVLTETHTETSITVAWEAVTNAESYIVNLGGKNYTTAECTYTFENLNAGEYTIRVKAQGTGYDSSDNAKITVTLTGLTSVDWFTQELIVLDEAVELENGTICQPYNALMFTWKGNGVADLQYAMFATADLEGAKDGEIKAALSGLGSSLDTILSYVNSEDGFMSVFGDLTGSTSYTLCALVKNAQGVECLVKSVATTAEAVVAEETKAWLGTYTAQTSQLIDLAAKEDAIKDQVTNFSFTVTSVEGTVDEVYIDGLSVMGAGNPALGQVFVDGEDGSLLLAVWNYVLLSEMSEGWLLYWYACCETMGDYYFVSGNYPAYILVMDTTGAITCEAYEGVLSNEEPFKVATFDLIGVNGENIGFVQDAEGNKFSVWKKGAYENIVKTDAAAAKVNNLAAKNLSIAEIVPASVVVAM